MRAALLAIGLLGIFLETGVAEVIVTSAGTVDVTDWADFDCRRPSQSVCSGNGVCQSDGSCQCNSADFGGDDCSLDLSGVAELVAGDQCTPQCQNGGQCYRPRGAADATGESCYCTGAFRLPAGEPGAADCSMSRAQLTECRAGDMRLLIYPQLSSLQGFAGEFGTQLPNQITTLTSSSCSASVANPGFDWNGNRFSFTFSTVQDATNPCELALQVDSTAADGTQKLCYDTRLYYSDQLLAGVRRFLPTDELFRFCCDENTFPTGAVPVGTGTGQDGSGAQVDSTIDILSTEIVYTSDNLPAPDASRPIGVGTPLSFVVAFASAGTRYNDIRILSCVSNPGALTLITDGCPNPNELSVIVGIRKDLANDRAFVDILAYRSTNDNNLQITCRVQVCVTTCVNPAPLCPGTGVANIGRKRREAEQPPTTNDTETLSVSRTIVITVGEPAGQVEGPTGTAPCDCAITSEVFIPVAVVFGALLMVVMTIAIFLCVRSSARNRDRKGSA